jgi:copper(I)-binding protein
MALPHLLMLLGLGMLVMSQWAIAETAGEGVLIKDPYVRAVPPGQPNSASFMALHNQSAKLHHLVGASSNIAELVEIHTHTMEEGMMRMRQVEKIALPAGETVTLKPGGLHVMLIGLKKKLVPDEEIDMVLEFSDGSTQQVTMPVKKIRMSMGRRIR